jgi:putative peptide zinc metalloprotease protein
LAFYVWLSVEPGVVRTLAYNAMLIAGVTTLTFNANPLLRFDGYYILSDLIEVPNLRQRASQHLRYLFEHYALALPDAEPVDASPGEKAWLLAFAIASPIYRMILIGLILLFVLQLSLVLGTLLAGITVVGWLVGPVASTLKLLLTSPRTRPVRGRVQLVLGGGLAVLLAVTCLLPLPYRSRAEGVVWIPDEAFVRAGTDGFVREVVATPGAPVQAGDVLFECWDSELDALVDVLKARVDGLQVRLQQARLDQPMQMAMLEEAVRVVRRQLARAQERQAELTLRASTDGVFVVPREQDLPGRFVRKGEIVGYVVQPEVVRIRAAVSEEAIELVRDRLEAIEVRHTERVGEVVPARLARLAPAATNRLPSVALGTAGGGALAVDPRDPEGESTVEKIFEVDVETAPAPPSPVIGSRVYLRFDHGLESLAARWVRSLRQLFLSRLDV